MDSIHMAFSIRSSRLQPLLRGATRTYHSYDHPSPAGPFNSFESTILSAAIPHLSSHGFTQTALALGAKDAGYLDASTNLFPKGAFNLVHYYLFTQRSALALHQHILQPDPQRGVGARVKALTWERLMANRDIIHRWQEALALMGKPTNVPASLHELHLLSDEIWFLSGDISVDTSWYTKRASLSTIYASTELFMTTDKSTEFKDTREFLNRRFEDSFKLGRMAGGLSQWLGFTAGATVNILRSKGVRI